MTLSTMPTDLSSLRDLNCADMEVVRSGLPGAVDLLETAEDYGSPILLAECLITRASHLAIISDVAAQDICLGRVESLLEDVSERDLRPIIRWGFAHVQTKAALAKGEYDLAQFYIQKATRLAEVSGYVDAHPSSLNLYGLLAYRLEAFDRAIELLTRSIAESALPRTLAIAHGFLANVFESLGELSLALSHRRISLEAVDESAVADHFRFKCFLCSTLIRLEEFDEVHAILEAMDPARPDKCAFATLLKAQLALAEGEFDLAYDQSDEAARLLEGIQLSSYEHAAFAVQGDALIGRGEYQRAISVLTNNLAPSGTVEHEKGCRQLAKAHSLVGQWGDVVHYQELLRGHMESRHLDLHSFHQLQEKSFRFEDLRAKNKALDERNQELEMVRSDRENLLNIVAHDLRSPLTALGLVVHSIGERAKVGYDFESHIHTGSRMIRRLQGLANQVATVGELASGKLELELSKVELDAVVGQVCEEQSIAASHKGINVRWTESHLCVVGHHGHLEQVLTNLLSNAIKFSSSASTVTIHTVETEQSVEIEVADEGPGLTDLDLDRVFRRHARLSARPTGGEPSSGMGLFIAKQLSLAMGGDLVAASPGDGQGAVFTIKMSLASVSGQRELVLANGVEIASR